MAHRGPVVSWLCVFAGVCGLIGCAGFEPYDPPNNREYPNTPGLFSGADGEFVIMRPQSPDPAETRQPEPQSSEN